jgi:hypothetical protein
MWTGGTVKRYHIGVGDVSAQSMKLESKHIKCLKVVWSVQT